MRDNRCDYHDVRSSLLLVAENKQNTLFSIIKYHYYYFTTLNSLFAINICPYYHGHVNPSSLFILGLVPKPQSPDEERRSFSIHS